MLNTYGVLLEHLMPCPVDEFFHRFDFSLAFHATIVVHAEYRLHHLARRIKPSPQETRRAELDTPSKLGVDKDASGAMLVASDPPFYHSIYRSRTMQRLSLVSVAVFSPFRASVPPVPPWRNMPQ